MIELNFPNAVREEKYFYGRRAELAQVEKVFTSGTFRPVTIYGERRIGKTSLMNVSASRLQAREIAVLFPATVGIYSYNDFVRELLQSLCDYRKISLRETGFLRDEPGFHPGVGYLFRIVEMLLEGSRAENHVLCIDEFDALLYNCLKYGEEAEAKKIIDLATRLLARIDLPMTFLLTMTHLPPILQDPFNTIIDEAERVNLYAFSRAETEELLRQALGDEIILADGQRDQLFSLSGGHPYILKLILSKLLLLVAGGASPLEVEDSLLASSVEEAVMAPHAEYVLGNILHVHFSPQERDLVQLMAELGHSITHHQLHRAGSEWWTAAKNLVKRGYLARENGSERFSFRARFLGLWLEKRPNAEERLRQIADLRSRLSVEIEIDQDRREMMVSGNTIALTEQEYQVLLILGEHSGRLVRKEEIANLLWPEAADVYPDAALAATIARLRRKLGAHARHHLETVAGSGYILHRAGFLRGYKHD